MQRQVAIASYFMISLHGPLADWAWVDSGCKILYCTFVSIRTSSLFSLLDVQWFMCCASLSNQIISYLMAHDTARQIVFVTKIILSGMLYPPSLEVSFNFSLIYSSFVLPYKNWDQVSAFSPEHPCSDLYVYNFAIITSSILAGLEAIKSVSSLWFVVSW